MYSQDIFTHGNARLVGKIVCEQYGWTVKPDKNDGLKARGMVAIEKNNNVFTVPYTLPTSSQYLKEQLSNIL